MNFQIEEWVVMAKGMSCNKGNGSPEDPLSLADTLVFHFQAPPQSPRPFQEVESEGGANRSCVWGRMQRVSQVEKARGQAL